MLNVVKHGNRFPRPKPLALKALPQRIRYARVVKVRTKVSVVGPVPIEVMVLHACTEVDGVLRSACPPATVKHAVVKNHHVTGLCGDPSRTSKGKPAP